MMTNSLEGFGMSTTNTMRWLGHAFVAMAIAVVGAHSASAQNSTGTIRGTVTGAGGVGLADAQISARNIESGVVRNTTSREQGVYVLAGLVPATYDMTVRRIGTSAVTRRVVAQIGATSVQDFTLADRPTQLQSVVVTAAPTVETRTSEVATNVTQAQISKLPTPSRNFLDLAQLAPGVTYHYRLLATNADGTNAGADQVFITQEAPSVIAQPASPVLVVPPMTTPQLPGAAGHPRLHHRRKRRGKHHRGAHHTGRRHGGLKR